MKQTTIRLLLSMTLFPLAGSICQADGGALGLTDRAAAESSARATIRNITEPREVQNIALPLELVEPLATDLSLPANRLQIANGQFRSLSGTADGGPFVFNQIRNYNYLHSEEQVPGVFSFDMLSPTRFYTKYATARASMKAMTLSLVDHDKLVVKHLVVYFMTRPEVEAAYELLAANSGNIRLVVEKSRLEKSWLNDRIEDDEYEHLYFDIKAADVYFTRDNSTRAERLDHVTD